MVRGHGRSGTEAEPVRDALRDQLFTEVNLNSAIRVEESTVRFENNSILGSDLRNFRPGNGSVTFTDGEHVVNTTADGASAQAIETARLGEYNAGLPGAIGLLIDLADDPVGFAEWGYGGENFTNELRFRLESDGTYRFDREREGVTTEIPRSLWEDTPGEVEVTDNDGDVVGEVVGKDPLDGTGPSGSDISTPVLGLFGVDFVLYGGGGFAPWFLDLTTEGVVEKVYPFVFRPRNETVLGQFNQPIFARLDNDGTATADSMTVAERQFSYFGTPTAEPRPTPHCFDLDKNAGSPTAVFGIRRESPTSPAPLSINTLQLNVDNEAHVYYLVNPTIAGGDDAANWVRPAYDFAGNQVPNKETTLEVNESLTVDATTGIPIEGGVALAGQGNTTITTDMAELDNSLFIRDEPVVMMVEPRAGASDVTSQEGVLTVKEAF
jgi:hypothetical protein